MFEIEPSGDMREMAANMRQYFVALCGAGFTEEQAMELTREMVRSSVLYGRQDEGK